MTIEIVRSVAELRRTIAQWRSGGASIAVVPTMGALHEGHLSLVRSALSQADKVVVTLFVNPRQFNSAEDLAAYPRTEVEDAQKLSVTGAHLLYVPDPDEIYPHGFATTVSVMGITDCLCGTHRPGHFDGVATIVTKLFLQTGADLAIFGEKDFQQLQVVRRLAADLDIPIQVVGCETVREADGLALSSRNVRLSRSERAKAPALAKSLLQASEELTAGQDLVKVLTKARDQILGAGYQEIDYLDYRSEDDLSPMAIADRPGRLLAAAWLGDVRLIDNVPVSVRS